MEGVNNFTEFVQAFSHFGADMVELAHLSGDRQNVSTKIYHVVIVLSFEDQSSRFFCLAEFSLPLFIHFLIYVNQCNSVLTAKLVLLINYILYYNGKKSANIPFSFLCLFICLFFSSSARLDLLISLHA